MSLCAKFHTFVPICAMFQLTALTMLKSGDVTNLELLFEEEKTFVGGFRPVSFAQCLGPRKDSSML